MITAGQLITDQDAFARLCHECLELDLVALDTEFERTRTYYPRPALVQLCDARRTMLVDPTALADFSPLGELLARERPSKVMHACEGDIEVLEVLAGVTPAAVFDTQVAAAFTGHGYSASYGELLRKVLGVDLAKAETRSDWLARPLTPAQLEYATLDVAYLPALHAALAARLEALGRRRWFDEEMARLQASRRADREPERAWRKIRSARTLAPQARARLEALAAWREREARRRDLPRRMVVGDDALLGLALEAPHARAELGRVRALSARAARRYGDELLETLAGAGSSAGAADDDALRPAPRARPDGRLLALLKEAVTRRAEELGMPPALLAQSRLLEAVAAAHAAGDASLPEELGGWRAEALGDALGDVLGDVPGGGPGAPPHGHAGG